MTSVANSGENRLQHSPFQWVGGVANVLSATRPPPRAQNISFRGDVHPDIQHIEPNVASSKVGETALACRYQARSPGPAVSRQFPIEGEDIAGSGAAGRDQGTIRGDHKPPPVRRREILGRRYEVGFPVTHADAPPSGIGMAEEELARARPEWIPASLIEERRLPVGLKIIQDGVFSRDEAAVG